MTKQGKFYMAFGKPGESVENTVYKKFIGVGVVSVLTVNPTKEELEKIYGSPLERDPEYLTDKDGVKGVRLDFIVSTDEEKHPGVNYVGKYSIFLENKPRMNADGTKVQVIDKYGETAWVTKEEAQKGIYDTEKFKRFSAPYKPALVGEEQLIQFLKTHLCITDSCKWENKTWVKKTGQELVDAEASLEKLQDIFTGNVKEIQGLISSVPENRTKLIFGIRTTDENKEYQTFYPRAFKLGMNDFNKVDAEIKTAKDAGRFPNTEFAIAPLKEYIVSKTEFTAPSTTAPTGGSEDAGIPKVDWFQ